MIDLSDTGSKHIYVSLTKDSLFEWGGTTLTGTDGVISTDSATCYPGGTFFLDSHSTGTVPIDDFVFQKKVRGTLNETDIKKANLKISKTILPLILPFLIGSSVVGTDLNRTSNNPSASFSVVADRIVSLKNKEKMEDILYGGFSLDDQEATDLIYDIADVI